MSLVIKLKYFWLLRDVYYISNIVLYILKYLFYLYLRKFAQLFVQIIIINYI